MMMGRHFRFPRQTDQIDTKRDRQADYRNIWDGRLDRLDLQLTHEQTHMQVDQTKTERQIG